MRRPLRVLSVALAALVLGPVFVLLAPVAAANSGPGPITPPNPMASGVSGAVFWNGRDVAGASSTSTAVQAEYASQVPVVFRWASMGGSPAARVNISDARIQLLYFGSAVTTVDSVQQSPLAAMSGSIAMTWQAGSVRWLIAGSYQLVASLRYAGNGSTAWSESFFLHLSAPYSLGAIVPALMAILGVMLLYEAAVSGRYSARPPPGAPASVTEGAAMDEEPTGVAPDEPGGAP